ncbi:porin family protein [Natronoflexus pectinivorans]|uniref:Outer membrane protein with beta-barrel domain n=1 Tax=Natronoflexus pectinivorans TaxID=682526 RepID=A0A4V2RW88_9BACT|nr:porin family protein [Natronoflexus pectinivorans]TCO07282.1 outer membrane protein with beta-barrel domain [Natronoflexus pectinivorans]
MNTKLFSLIILLSLLVPIAAISQQAAESRTSIGILGGINFQNLNGKDIGGSSLENDMLIGFHAGLNAQMPLAPEFYFQPGLIFSTKGAKNSEGVISSTYKLSYIELPLNLVYKAMVGNGYFFLGFGPYVAYGVGGKATYEGGPASFDADIEFKNKVNADDPLTTVYVKPFDAGANLFFGYELQSGLFLQLNTQLGLLNISPEDNRITGDDQSTLKNTGFGMSLGYRL